MSTHNKNHSQQLPFTQLWYNFSKHCQKQNRSILKPSRAVHKKQVDKDLFKSMYDEIMKKRSSYEQTNNNNMEYALRNISVDDINNGSRKKKGKDGNGENKKNKEKERERNSICEFSSMVVESAKSRKQLCSDEQESEKNRANKISDKVLKII